MSSFFYFFFNEGFPYCNLYKFKSHEDEWIDDLISLTFHLFLMKKRPRNIPSISLALEVVMATFLLSSEDKFVDQCEPQSLDRIVTDNMRPEYLEPTLNLILALVIIFLHGIALIILVNILLRPSLWTAFNIVGLIYLCLTIVLGSYKLVQISVLVSTFLKLEETDGIVIVNQISPWFN